MSAQSEQTGHRNARAHIANYHYTLFLSELFICSSLPNSVVAEKVEVEMNVDVEKKHRIKAAYLFFSHLAKRSQEERIHWFLIAERNGK